MDLDERLNLLASEIRKQSFRTNRGKANEVNYSVFDYPPQKELEVRKWIKSLQTKDFQKSYGFALMIYDLYDIIIDILEQKGFLEQCYQCEREDGLDTVVKIIGDLLMLDEDSNLIVKHIEDNTPEDAVVFLVGIGKCYPLLRSHKLLNSLSQSFNRAPVVLFFPGTYDEQSLNLFDELKDDNYYRAFRLVKS